MKKIFFFVNIFIRSVNKHIILYIILLFAFLHTQTPVIDVWYGNTQYFGQIGMPQQWINILGKVTDPERDVSSLSYSLNGGAARMLSFAGDGSCSDGLRLWNEGEFNIDIDKEELLNGNNEVVITARDSLGHTSGPVTVTVNNNKSSTWPLPYVINWSSVSKIGNVSQVIDGNWYLTGTGIRPMETGFDRLIAIGEGSFNEKGWTEYEVTVEVTVHGYHNDGFLGTQVAPALGIAARWQGHTDFPISGCQPKCGWMPVGCVSWYTWDRNDRNRAYFGMWAHSADKKVVPDSPMMELNVPYYWKMRIENTISRRGTYFQKVWKKGESEPAGWLSRFDETMRNWSYTMLESGSILLLSHHVDVTFGNVEIRPLGGVEATPTPTPTSTQTTIPTPTLSPTPSPTLPPTDNLVVNPGFESGAYDWVYITRSEASIVSSPVHSGSKALKLSLDPVKYVNVFQDVPVTAGSEYNIVLWIKAENITSGYARLYAEWYTDIASQGGSRVGKINTGIINGNTAFMKVTHIATAPTGAQYLKLYMSTVRGTGAAYFDDVTVMSSELPVVTSTPTPTDD
ncbi:hypothetical protein ACFL6D_05475, partial [Spirochaetota bacterium]